ncbi:inositol 2-dehydrogenase [Candidatus Poribacteria bacterium]|nr:inositol 2-dehydrogenase [Candidatus Poribacteria bacterium]MYB64762.1 inositol 2-dehydrogenase [Candidatus Poribacteria bacterium]MYI93685.1 inositol 2-dehydrogenase [Candidatus Poribacteria bacterium]
MNTSSKIGVGVVGTGRIGGLHIQHLSQNIHEAEIVSICSLDIETAETLSKQFNISETTTDYRKLLTNPQIDAVLVASSTDTHVEICQAAAKAGKHIFCEKPIALDLKRIDETLAIVKEAKVKFQVGFNRRFDKNFQRVRDAVVSGAIGEPHILRITSRDPVPPPIEYAKVSGGMFLDMTIHDFDMARYLIDDEVIAVYAVGAVRVDPKIGEIGDIDTAVITLQFQNGVLATIDNSRKAVYGYDQRVEVFGAKGMVTVGNLSTDTVTLTNNTGRLSANPPYFFIERYKDAYLSELRTFVQCILDDKQPPVSGVDGRAPVVMGYAALKSLRENRPVKLSEIG